MYQIARRLLPVLEFELGLAVYPDWNTCWHYDDKVAQRVSARSGGDSHSRTWVWFDATRRGWSRTASYPLVLKLSSGASSANIRQIRNETEAARWIRRLFGAGGSACPRARVPGVGERCCGWPRNGCRAGSRSGPPIVGTAITSCSSSLPDNSYDTRVVVIGNRAFGFRRFNRPTISASGSGRIDYTPGEVDERFIRLAFRTAAELRTQSCGIDGLYRGAEPVIGEISYTYVSFPVWACPGHWELPDAPRKAALAWHDGHLWPEEANSQISSRNFRRKQVAPDGKSRGTLDNRRQWRTMPNAALCPATRS